MTESESHFPPRSVPEDEDYPRERPPWYIQGSYVMDSLFRLHFAQDVDVFFPGECGDTPPSTGVVSDHPVHAVALPDEYYYPPLLGNVYNVDKYIITPAGVQKPPQYPEKPDHIELIQGKTTASLIDIIRGIKYSLRYNLPVSPATSEIWKKQIEDLFGPQYRENMMFDSLEDVIDYIRFTLSDNTSESERQRVAEVLQSLTSHVF